MVGIILCTHATFAEGLRASVEMIAGEQEDFTSICFLNGDNVDELKEKMADIAKQYEEKGNGVCYVVDLYGASPFNAAMMCSAEHPGVIMTGANLPMMLELITSRADVSKEDLTNYLNNVINSVKENMQVIDSRSIFE